LIVHAPQRLALLRSDHSVCIAADLDKPTLTHMVVAGASFALCGAAVAGRRGTVLIWRVESVERQGWCNCCAAEAAELLAAQSFKLYQLQPLISSPARIRWRDANAAVSDSMPMSRPSSL